MFKKIDQSNILLRLLQQLSSWLAKNRGLPIIVGIVLILVSTILQLFSPGSDATLHTINLLLQNGGIIIALIGILLMEPLGK